MVATRRSVATGGRGVVDWLGVLRTPPRQQNQGADPDDVPVLIGQLPLEHFDFVIDSRSRTLTGNPAHGDEHVYELSGVKAPLW